MNFNFFVPFLIEIAQVNILKQFLFSKGGYGSLPDGRQSSFVDPSGSGFHADPKCRDCSAGLSVAIPTQVYKHRYY